MEIKKVAEGISIGGIKSTRPKTSPATTPLDTFTHSEPLSQLPTPVISTPVTQKGSLETEVVKQTKYGYQPPQLKAIERNISGKKFLNIFWNQHQPSYKDEVGDCFTQPWVRLHSTKDYYDMAAILEHFPNVHITINLSSSLLKQLDDYLDKLYDYCDVESKHRGDINYYPEGHVDRELDLTVKPVEEWTKEDKIYALDHFFAATPQSQIFPFQGYKYLYDKRFPYPNAKAEEVVEKFTDQDFRDLKVWFNLVWMDHIFMEKDVTLIGDKVDGTPMEPPESVTIVDDLIRKGVKAGYGNSGFSEEEAKGLVMDQYKIMKYVVPVHRHFQNKIAPDGFPQLEVVTTPFYHPILPLIYNTDLAKEPNPGMPLPNPPFTAPEDAYAQVAKGAEYYKKKFGRYPQGMWPGEGSVAEAVVPAFVDNNIRWIATGNEVAMRSGHVGDTAMMYRIDKDKEYIDHSGPGGTTDNSDAMSIVFRSMHDKVGFDYGYHKGKIDGKDAAGDFLNIVKNYRHWNNVPENEPMLVTNTADGENAWTFYSNDGWDFLSSLYGQLNDPNSGIETITPSAYAKLHPVDKQWELEPLAAGSWVGGDFSTWIGEPSENEAWRRLRLTREALVKAGVPQPDPHKPPPDPFEDREKYFAWKAWEELYAAEGSDWFWWYGDDQDSGNDRGFSVDHRTHMVNVYVFAKKAGYDMEFPAEQKLPLDQSTEIVPVPPITEKPEVDKKVITAGVATPVKFKVKAFTPPQEGTSMREVTMDLRPLGGDKKVPMKPKPDGTYELSYTVPKNVKPGKYLLTIIAQAENKAKSLDYIGIQVVDNKEEDYLISS